jgi:hypothetical protein
VVPVNSLCFRFRHGIWKNQAVAAHFLVVDMVLTVAVFARAACLARPTSMVEVPIPVTLATAILLDMGVFDTFRAGLSCDLRAKSYSRTVHRRV